MESGSHGLEVVLVRVVPRAYSELPGRKSEEALGLGGSRLNGQGVDYRIDVGQVQARGST